MPQGRAPGAAGPELVPPLAELLARLGDDARPEPRPAFAERLGEWLGWSGAITLSTALGAAPAAGRGASLAGAEADLRRVRAGQEAAIADGPDESAATPDDFGPLLRHCLARQQAMHDAVAALRGRLREALRASGSPRLARLAAVDAALDDALAASERRLLGLLPKRLETRFDRLRRAADDETAPSRALREELDLALRAELAHRLLPARGLLDAWRDALPTDPRP